MSEPYNLLVDIGNSSIKYAFYQQGSAIADLQVLRTSLESFPDLLEKVSKVWLCNVSSNNISESIVESCNQQHIEIEQTQTLDIQFGLSNAYPIPSNMGCDRWMALIASCAMHDEGRNNNLIVIDAGTAITCDFVIQNTHVGGWIAPGLQLARDTVVKQTQKVFDDKNTLHILKAGTDTPECVANGALAQITGLFLQAITHMQQKLAEKPALDSNKFQVYISGGDAPLIIENITHLKNDKCNYGINYIENLVLVGLAKLASESS